MAAGKILRAMTALVGWRVMGCARQLRTTSHILVCPCIGWAHAEVGISLLP